MSPASRRRVLAGIAALVLSSGCSLGQGEGESPASPNSETTVEGPLPSETGPETDSRPRTTESSAFTDLTVETDRTWCPADDHWEPAYHRTPMSPPKRPPALTRRNVTEYAASYEDFVLTYLAVREHGPQTPETVTPGEPEVLAFPETDLRDRSTEVLDEFEDGFVVRLTYSRVIEGESDGAYTVNYYVDPRQTVRAETQGRTTPGPNPAKSGAVLEC